MKNPKSFSIISSYLLLENRFKIKLLMNFEPVLKRAVVCFFDPCATVYSRKSWGVLGTNLVSSAQSAHDPLVSREGEVETWWRHRQDFPPLSLKFY